MLLLTPGPTPIPERVQKALLRPMRGHLDPEVLAVNRAIQERLRTLFGAPDGALLAALAGSGSLGMEAGLANLDAGPVLVLVNGAFSARMAEMARLHGLDPTVLEFPPGEPVDPERVARALKAKPYRMVAMVHGETSTGVLNPAEAVGALAKEAGALFYLDAVTTLGMLPFSMEAMGVDYAFTGSQKCLSAPPGLAPIAASPEARKAFRAKRGWYLDLERVAEHWERGGYHHTTPVLLHFALLEALDLALEEGIPARAKRAQETYAWLLGELSARGFRPYPKGSPLPTVLVVRPPEGVEADRLVKALYGEGVAVAGGIGPTRGQVLRLGLMGEGARRPPYEAFLKALDRVLALA
ncbi:serine-pyruvate aminotransferase/archaeal aspartate aminotransferase [Thermus oshimai JL-2]|uniref:Serine-pyruvate aminotransferase/archaeal aspartate aminotransferase n=1 Tax=Thermus oshimai JL-2 TaxID=751945 RepID=K7R7R8_THEOS|nr:aminotransferase class V-fold PLP-dependent enzyme [Thermus oshimai]AFV77069.1 serine-pyruvate aminotransferase/archaeal aspartate aminotransferase [Thermus oshimai JL-2]